MKKGQKISTEKKNSKKQKRKELTEKIQKIIK
jgi:hypothetical protein